VDLTTLLVGVASLVLGWGLKTWTESWTWRRQQVLDAYMELLDTADRCGPDIGRVWNTGQKTAMRDQVWVDRALTAQVRLEDVDRASGKMFLVANSPAAAEAAIELYIALLRMYRRAIARPPRSWDDFHAASIEMVKAYHDVVDHGRKEMALRNWRDRLPGQVSRFELTDRKLQELDKLDPLPKADEGTAEVRPPTPSWLRR